MAMRFSLAEDLQVGQTVKVAGDESAVKPELS